MGAASLAGSYLDTVPQIVWGPALEHTIEVGFPVRRAVTYPELQPGGYAVELRYAQNRDFVTLGVEYRMELELGPVTGIAIATGPFGAPMTGFDDAGGWDDFLRWAADPGQVFNWVPDRSTPGEFRAARLLQPFQSTEGVRRAPFRLGRMIQLTIVSDDGEPFTGY